MKDLEHQLSLVHAALEAHEAGCLTSRLLEKTIRIARLRNDLIALYWLELETLNASGPADFKNKRDAQERELGIDPTPWFKEASLNTYLDERKIHIPSGDGGMVITRSVAEIERTHSNIEPMSNFLSEPLNDASISEQDRFEMRLTQAQNQHFSSQIEIVLGRIKDRLVQYLIKIESAILLELRVNEVLTPIETYVHTRLVEISPKASEQLAKAAERLASGEEEALSHALQSIRRMLQSLADVLYPATDKPVTGSDGKSRILGSDQYISRLWQYIYEQEGKNSQNLVVLANIEGLGRRIDALYSIASKGVHATVTLEEVQTCVMEIYAVVAHLLRLEERLVDVGLPESGIE